MQLYWQFNRYYVNHFRKEVLDLPEIRRLGPFGSSQWNNQLFLFGFSQYLIPKPEDWPANAHITGFGRFDADACYHPPEDLLDFISAGPKPVYLGFGSMPGNENENLL
jgi:sterol 3beta-glucosyltransferase